MALLSIFLLPAQAAALLVIPSLVTNVWQTRPFGTLAPMLRRVGGMQLGVACGTLAGALILGAPAGAWAGISLGVLLVIYSAWTLFGRPFRSEEHTELQSLMRISYAVFCLKKKKRKNVRIKTT